MLNLMWGYSFNTGRDNKILDLLSGMFLYGKVLGLALVLSPKHSGLYLILSYDDLSKSNMPTKGNGQKGKHPPCHIMNRSCNVPGNVECSKYRRSMRVLADLSVIVDLDQSSHRSLFINKCHGNIKLIFNYIIDDHTWLTTCRSCILAHLYECLEGAFQRRIRRSPLNLSPKESVAHG